MAKGRSQRGREVKKPKADKTAVPASSTFLRQPPRTNATKTVPATPPASRS